MYIYIVTISVLFVHISAFLQAEFVCPVPYYVSPITEDVCTRYSSCEWRRTRCVLGPQSGYFMQTPNELRKINKTLSMFGGDLAALHLTQYWYDNNIYRILVEDQKHERYKVPLCLKTSNKINRLQKGSKPVDILPNIPESPDVSSRIILPLNTLIYEDQFIEFHLLINSVYFYGFGENNHDTFLHNRSRGITWPIFARDQAPTQRGAQNLYGTHPFFVTFFEDIYYGLLILNSNAMELRFEDCINSSEWSCLIFRTIGGVLDIYVFVEDSPLKVVESYHRAIGTTFMPPYWSLGFQLSRFGYKDFQDILNVIERNKAVGIPLDVQYIDIDYMQQYKDFTVNSDKFGDLDRLANKLWDDYRIRLVLILDPAIALNFNNYTPIIDGLRHRVFLRWMNSSYIPADQCAVCDDYIVGRVWPKENVLFPDFFQHNTLNWWKKQIYSSVIGRLHGIWLDMNEPSNFNTNPDEHLYRYLYNRKLIIQSDLRCPNNKYDKPPFPTMASPVFDGMISRLSYKTICMSSAHNNTLFSNLTRSTLLHYDVHNLYGWSQLYATHLATSDESTRRILFSRSTYVGSGQWGGHWSGDISSTWHELRRSIVEMLEFSMFGIQYIGTDICGFNGNTSEILCLRWHQLGAFYPLSRNHNTIDASDQDPARWVSVSRAAREALEIRYRLLPLLYTLFYRAHVYGELVIRSLAFQFPQELSLRNLDSLFLWGDCLLIAPVINENPNVYVSVKFPPVGWYDLRSGKLASRYSKVQTINYYVDTKTMIPVFVREGCIVPMQQNGTNVEEARVTGLQLHVFGKRAKGQFYWDDGVSRNSIAFKHYHLFDFIFQDQKLYINKTHLSQKYLAIPLLDRIVFYGVSKAFTRILINGHNIVSTSFDGVRNIFTIYDIGVRITQNILVVLR